MKAHLQKTNGTALRLLSALIFNRSLALLAAGLVYAQQAACCPGRLPGADSLPRPRLVVGIVVDQMRYDYLYRYYDKYSEGGFKRMMREGFSCRSHHYHYGNTSTGAGHASIYTGSAPAIHGIIGNDWYDPAKGHRLNCVGDSLVKGVGVRHQSSGKASPRNMLVPTVTDQLRLATNFRSRTVSIALKDRAAVLPGGHTANAAYWYDGYTGNWITSTFYMDSLPDWVHEFNARRLPSAYLKEGWKSLLPMGKYTESTSDNQFYEEPVPGNKIAAFPYELAGKSGDAFGLIGAVPAGNTLTREMTVAAIKGENLGKESATDFLAISFSAPDIIGHRHGPNSVEQQDVYLRLDLELAAFFRFLDNWVGKEQYTVFLSADHGVIDVPEFWQSHRIPAGRLSPDSLYARVRQAIGREFKDESLVRAVDSRQVYLDKKKLRSKRISTDEVLEVVREEILLTDGVADVFNSRKLNESTLPEYHRKLYLNEIHPKRSGDLLIVFEPGWITRATYGTTHGSPYHYDTHVPFLISGWGIRQGETFRRTYISDIAPTLSALLQVLPPAGNIGEVIEEILKKP